MELSNLPSYLAADRLGAWAIYLEQIERVKPHLGKLGELVETLTRPKRILIVDVPIRLDDGRVAHFEGYRIQHNTARGPGKGGVRFHPDVSLADVMAQNFDGYFNTGDLLDALRDAGKKAIANALALVRKHDLKAESALFESLGGRVSEVIVKEARKWRADLIVMGTHGRRGVTRMVLGSDAEAILRVTPVPVMLVRSPDRKKRRG